MKSIALSTRAATLGGLLLLVAACIAWLMGGLQEATRDPIIGTVYGGSLLAGCLSILMVPVLRLPEERVPRWIHAVVILAAVVLGFLMLIGPLVASAETKGFHAKVPLPALLAWGLSLPGVACAFWLHRGLPRRR